MLTQIAITMLLLDFIYLKLITHSFSKMIYNIQNKPLNLKIKPAILCYFLLISVYYCFIAKDNKSVFDAFFLGFAIYGIYDTTNIATINAWKWDIVAVDTLWGGSLFALTHIITNKLK